MIVNLTDLQPNPFRDFGVDPIDPEVVDRLCQSITKHGFWSGIVVRQIGINGQSVLQIGAGHHRVTAALKAGVTKADVFVRNDMNDEEMTIVYATENSTQRGNFGTATTGSVAAVVRLIAKTCLSIHSPGSGTMKNQSLVNGSMVSEEKGGIGARSVLELLKDVPGINKKVVEDALVNLKSCGAYARIVKEVKEELEREQAEALLALANAEKEHALAQAKAEEAKAKKKEADAAAKAAKEEADKKKAELERQKAEKLAELAAKRAKEIQEELAKFQSLKTARDTAEKAVHVGESHEVDFDFEGVAKHLKLQEHIRVFRRCVTGAGIKPYLPVSGQAALAQHIVELAAERKKDNDKVELNSDFIRNNIMVLVLDAKGYERQMTKKEREQQEQEDRRVKANHLMDEFCRHGRLMIATGVKIRFNMDQWKQECPQVAYPGIHDLRDMIEEARKFFNELSERIKR